MQKAHQEKLTKNVIAKSEQIEKEIKIFNQLKQISQKQYQDEKRLLIKKLIKICDRNMSLKSNYKEMNELVVQARKLADISSKKS